MSNKPTLILVPGAWFPADSWRKVVPLMEARQFKCVCLALPSAKSNSSTTFLDDIQAVRAAITAETTQGRDVVVVVHSFSCMPCHSASKGLTLPSTPPLQGDPSSGDGHVLGFAMLASGFTQTGMSFLDVTGGSPPPFWKAENGFATFVVDPRDLFFNDLPEDEGRYWADSLGQQSLKSLAEGGEHAYAAWMDAPSWYLAAAQDRPFPVETQRMGVQMAKDAGADVTIREVESGHSAMLSKPQETADFLSDAVAYFVGRKTDLTR